MGDAVQLLRVVDELCHARDLSKHECKTRLPRGASRPFDLSPARQPALSYANYTSVSYADYTFPSQPHISLSHANHTIHRCRNDGNPRQPRETTSVPWSPAQAPGRSSLSAGYLPPPQSTSFTDIL